MKKTLILMAVLALTACGSSPKNTDGKSKQTLADPPCPAGSYRTFEGYCQRESAAGTRSPQSGRQPVGSNLPRPQLPAAGLPPVQPLLGR